MNQLDASPEAFLNKAGGTTLKFAPRLVEPQNMGEGDGGSDGDDEKVRRFTLKPTDIKKLPPRQWLYGNFAIIGQAAVLGAVDGGGKGTIVVSMMLSVVTGQPLLGEKVWRTGPVAIVSYEDDAVEWHRRIAAACLHYGLDYEFVLANIHFIERPGDRICFAGMGERNKVIFPDHAAVVGHMKATGAIMLIVDPFNHAHNFDDGNNNVLIAKAAGELSCIAKESRAAVLLLHHLRKGSNVNGDPDDLMGAVSLRATFRSCRILQRMTKDIGARLKIPVKEIWRYIRVVGGKENYSLPPEGSLWFKLETVWLENGTEDYPAGDSSGVATRWEPRALFDDMTADDLREIFRTLKKTPHSKSSQSKNTPWAGIPLISIGGRSKAEASKIIGKWIESKLLTESTYYHAESKNTVGSVVLDEAKADEILAELRATDPDAE
jgi:hypothetical protein